MYTLDTINADLRVVWGALSKEGKDMWTPKVPPPSGDMRAPLIPPFGVELGAASARHFFLALDELGDKLVKTTVAKRLPASSSKFAWSARVCQQVEAVRAERDALFGSDAQSTEWKRVSTSLQLSLLASSMESVAESWWSQVGQPLWAFCRAERFHPGAFAVSRLVPRLAVAASALLPRLRGQLESARHRCLWRRAHLSEYELLSCETLVDACHSKPLETEQQGAVSSLLLDVTILKWRVAALAADAWANKFQTAPAQGGHEAASPKEAAQHRPIAATPDPEQQGRSVSSDDSEPHGLASSLDLDGAPHPSDWPWNSPRPTASGRSGGGLEAAPISPEEVV